MKKTYEIICMNHVTTKRVNPFHVFEYVHDNHHVTEVLKKVDSFKEGLEELRKYTSTVERDKSFFKWIYIVSVYSLRTTYYVDRQKLHDYIPAKELRYIKEKP